MIAACHDSVCTRYALIHGEAEQKRKAGDRWDRVEGRIESLIQGRARSRGGLQPLVLAAPLGTKT